MNILAIIAIGVSIWYAGFVTALVFSAYKIHQAEKLKEAQENLLALLQHAKAQQNDLNN